MDRFDRLVRGGDEFVQDLRGPVSAAVVDEDELVVGDDTVEGSDNGVIQRSDVAFFVVAGDDK